MIVISVFLTIILGTLAVLHVYWALGGSWGKAAVLPERDGTPLFRPSRAATLCVASALGSAAVCAAMRSEVAGVSGAEVTTKVGCWVLMLVFGTRAIGEGRYVGFTKQLGNTTFARNDTWIYSPLCTVLAAGFLALALGG